MVLPYLAFDPAQTLGTTERRQRDELLDRLARLVAATDDHDLLAHVVTDLEISANASLGAATSDPTVVLTRRFARAHRRIVTGASTATAAAVRHWIAEFDAAAARRFEAPPPGRAAASPQATARNGSTSDRIAPRHPDSPRSILVGPDGTCARAS